MSVSTQAKPVTAAAQQSLTTPGLLPVTNPALLSGTVTLTVGKGEMYATLAQAVAAAPNGSVVLVDAGTYTNDFATVTTSITIEGVGGMANFVANVPPPNDKGILTVDNNVTVENCSFSGCAIPDADGANGAGIRYEGGQMVLENDSFSNNQNGILGAPVIDAPVNTVSVDHCLFQNNGSGTGYTHNFYMGDVSRVTFKNSISEGAQVGHEFKSRAYVNDIENNVFQDGATGTASYEIDLPDGGKDTVIGNVIEKGANAQNEAMVHFGGEGIAYAGSALTVSGNDFKDNYGPDAIAVLNQTATSATIQNNTFENFSADNIASGPATLTNNVDGGGNAIADQTQSGVLPGSTEIFTDSAAHTVTLTGTLLAVQGGGGLLTATAADGHVVAIGGVGGLDFSEIGTSGGNTITTMAGSVNTLNLNGQDIVDSEGTDTIDCGAGNVTALINGVATIADGTGSEQWTVNGTASITADGDNPVVSIGNKGGATIAGQVGFLHVISNGGSFAYAVSQGGNQLAVSGARGALDAQVYNGESYITTAAGAVGARLTLTSGNAQVLSVGADVIRAGSGNATVIVEGAATVYAGTGSLSLFGRGDTAGAKLYGNGGDYLISGDTGNITYYGGPLASTVEAQLSNIELIGGRGLMTVHGGSRNVMIGGIGGLNYTATDGGGADTITTIAPAHDTLTLAGSDVVNSYGTDVINGGGGNQTITVHGNTTINGSTGNSQLTFAGNDVLNTVGADWCSVAAGATLSVNSSGSDVVNETGATVKFSAAGASATVSGGAATIDCSKGVKGIAVCTTAGSSTHVTFTGGSNTLSSRGADVIKAGGTAVAVQLCAAGADVIGGSAALTISNADVTAGNEQTVQGGSGTLIYSQYAGALTFIGGSGAAALNAGSGSMFVTAGSGALSLSGGQAGFHIVAGSGSLFDALATGGGTVEFGSGSATVQEAGFGAANLFDFDVGHGGGSDAITGFRAGTDSLVFNGVSVESETVTSGSTNLVLSDNTSVTLVGFVDSSHLF